MQAQRKENDGSRWRHLASNGALDIEENYWFFNANRIISVTF